MKHRFFGAGLAILAVFAFNTCSFDDVADVISKTAPVGVYVGVVSFAADNSSYQPVKDLVASTSSSNSIIGSLVYLGDDASKNTLTNTVLGAYTVGATSNTPLYYAVDSVITKLKNSEKFLSSKLDNVTIVTFTDGYDQGSATYANAGGGGGRLIMRTEIRSEQKYEEPMKTPARGRLRSGANPSTLTPWL
jgi:hypothetical protein